MAIFNQSALKSFINYIKRLLEHTLLTAISMIIISIVVIIYSIPSNGLNIWEIYRLNKFQFEYVGGYDLLEPYFLIQDVKIDDNNNRLTFTGRITNIDQGPWLHPRPYAIFYVDNIRMGNCFSYSIHSIYAKIELVGPNESRLFSIICPDLESNMLPDRFSYEIKILDAYKQVRSNTGRSNSL